MAQQSLIDAFDDCLNRIADGQSLDQCLNLYPAYSSRLRPLLEASIAIRQIRVPETEVLEDQALVWQQILQEIPAQSARRRRGYPLGLLAAVLLLLALLVATWLFLTRPQLPPDDDNVIVPATDTIMPSVTPTASVTVSVTPTVSLTWTPTPSTTVTNTQTSTPTSTVTVTSTPIATITSTLTMTKTRTPQPTKSPTATFAPGCAAPLSEQDAIKRVLAIYPNTTVIKATQTVKFGGTLVWEIQTSHNTEINIDVACGVILTIEQGGNNNSNTSSDNTNDNVNGDNATNNSSDTNSNGNDNSNSSSDNNSNDNTDDNSGSDDSGGDNSGGMGSDG